MALISCPECGKSVSDKAEVCPHCGIRLIEAPESKQTTDSVKKKPIPIYVPLLFAALYFVTLFINGLEKTQQIWMFSTGGLLIAILCYMYYLTTQPEDTQNTKIIKYLRYAFVVVFIVGAVFVSFEYNFSRMFNDSEWWNDIFEDYHFLDAYEYMESFTLVMVIFQIVSILAMLLFFLFEISNVKLSKSVVSGILFFTAAFGLFYALFEAVYLKNSYGDTIYSVYIETGVMIMFYYLTGATFSLTSTNQ